LPAFNISEILDKLWYCFWRSGD